MVAIGGSQSAGRLATYINAVQPLEGVFDAFMPFLYFGSGSPLEVGDYVFNPAEPGERRGLPGVPCRLRDDIDAKILIANSELEAIACYPVRQPDTDRFRNWEAAGTAHVSAQSMRARAEAIRGEVDAPAMDFTGINEVPLNPVVESAYHHLQAWVATGTPPPSQPRIEFAGEPPEVVRDDDAIAREGIRLPQVEVPLATNSAVATPNGVMGFLGWLLRPVPPGEGPGPLRRRRHLPSPVRAGDPGGREVGRHPAPLGRAADRRGERDLPEGDRGLVGPSPPARSDAG